jgi:replicative superfamily II helicase
MAAKICLGDKYVLATIPAGQGKTIVMLLIALWLVFESKMNKITFVTARASLKD